MRIIKGFLALVLLIVGIFSTAQAQMNGRSIRNNNHRLTLFRGPNLSFPAYKRYNFAGFSVNSSNYFGDLAPASNLSSTDIKFTRPGFSISYGRRYGPRYSFRGSFTWGTLTGDDFKSADPYNETAKYRYVRNLQFRNRISEIASIFIFDLLENPYTYLRRPTWTPYAFIGVAIFHHNPKAKVPDYDVHTGTPFNNAGEWVALQPLGTEGQNTGRYNNKPYSRIQPAIPMGIGVRFRIADQYDLELEIGLRYLFFDYIDDVSGSYVDLGSFEDPVARALSDRSQEKVSVNTSKSRDFSIIEAITTSQTYVGKDGKTYTVYRGYGSDLHPSNIRGNVNDRDIYIITCIRISRILQAYQNTRPHR